MVFHTKIDDRDDRQSSVRRNRQNGVPARANSASPGGSVAEKRAVCLASGILRINKRTHDIRHRKSTCQHDQ